MTSSHSFLFIVFLALIGSASSESSASSDFSLAAGSRNRKKTALILDVDNTLYQEQDAGIEAQIILNTYKFCEQYLDLSNEQADDLFHTYASTIEGLKRTLWRDLPPLKLQASLNHAYRNVWNVENMDLSSLLPLSDENGGGGSTGYSHTQNNKEKDLIRRLLKSSPHPIFLASNSPSWHIYRVLDAMGLSEGGKNPSFYKGIYTPDRLESYPTKHDPGEFFRADKRHNIEEDLTTTFDRLLVLDDSQHNLKQILSHFSEQASPQGMFRISSNYSLLEALLDAYGLVDPTYTFSQVDYLQCKGVVDRQSIHPATWHMVVDKIHQVAESSKDTSPIRIVDLGAGLLSMLQLVIQGDTDNGLRPLLSTNKGSKHVQVHYTAYESNRGLLQACHERLIQWGFALRQQQPSQSESSSTSTEDELVYEHPQVTLRLRLYDYEMEEKKEERNDPPPDLIVGCCFADLMDPNHLVPSLIRRFNLLRHSLSTTTRTLLYFPITFCGTTQFFPPQPFELQGSSCGTSQEDRRIPSDTAAFNLYAKALTETLGHNLNPRLLQDVLERHGASLLYQGPSFWNIDSKKHSYLFDTMMYFFGTSGGPELLDAGWDAHAWIQRAKERRPTIRVSNVDLLFEMGGGREISQEETLDQGRVSKKTPRNWGESNRKGQEILFTAPNKVGTSKTSIPQKLGPNQVLVRSVCSLISSGTELKIFKGLFDDASLDVNIKGMEHERMAFPLAYGYSLVGHIVSCGSDVDKANMMGKLVFTFSPHATHVVADVNSLHIVPEGITAEDAVFMPSVETALSLVHDAHVRVGENVAVYGQGLIGLLVTSILSMHQSTVMLGKFGTISVFDTLADRLAAASQMGASQALLPASAVDAGPFDVSIEVSGNPRALQSAIDCTSDGGRVIVGSWYGNKDVALNLGIDFHRSHKIIQTSQVSTIPAHLQGLWSKERRFNLAWELVQRIRPSKLLTKKVSLDQAQEAYEALDKGTEIAVAFDYTNTKS